MMIKKIWLTVFLLAVGILVYSTLLGKAFYFNGTQSAPRGIYLSIPYFQLAKGDFVIVPCPVSSKVKLSPDNLLLKCVAGLPDDWYTVKEDGILINEKFYRKQHVRFKCKAMFPKGMQKVPAGKLLLLNEYPFSFDSRYFGYVEEKNIKNKVVFILSLEGL